jgi:hypothetical protein
MLLLNSVDQIRKKLHIVYIVFFFLQRISFSLVYLFVYNLKKMVVRHIDMFVHFLCKNYLLTIMF